MNDVSQNVELTGAARHFEMASMRAIDVPTTKATMLRLTIETNTPHCLDRKRYCANG
jgi:hypothetical protein